MFPVGGSRTRRAARAVERISCVHEASAASWLADQLHLELARADLALLAQATEAWRERDLRRWSGSTSGSTRESAELRLQSERWLVAGRGFAAAAARLLIPRNCRAAHARSPSYPLAFALALAVLLPAASRPARDSMPTPSAGPRT